MSPAQKCSILLTQISEPLPTCFGGRVGLKTLQAYGQVQIRTCSMTRRSKITLLVVILAVIGVKAVKIALNAFAVPSCHSEETIKGMIAALGKPDLGTLAVNNAVSLSGGVISDTRLCTADIAPIRGGVDAADMHWMRVTYEVRKAASPAKVAVTAKLDGDTTLAAERSQLARWIEYFLD
jgi:hypothetical protein